LDQKLFEYKLVNSQWPLFTQNLSNKMSGMFETLLVSENFVNSKTLNSWFSRNKYYCNFPQHLNSIMKSINITMLVIVVDLNTIRKCQVMTKGYLKKQEFELRIIL